jgi:alpha-glucosidase
VGDVPSNLDNVRQRYALIPYLYSLAHRAYLYGEPVVPPLVYYYPGDPNVREMGDQKLLGRDLLVAAVTEYGQAERCVYLPAGEWIDYYTHDRYASDGGWFGPFPAYVDTPAGTRFRLPTFARAGAIVPQMHVDDRTMNASGQRTDGSLRDELIVRVYADETPSAFTLYEDDGRTMAYQRGEVRTTSLSQVRAGDAVTVTIGGALGDYAGAPASRDNVVSLALDRGADVSEVMLTVGVSEPLSLPRYDTQRALDAAPRGWVLSGSQLVAKSGKLNVATPKVFRFEVSSQVGEAFSPDNLAFLPLVLDGDGLDIPPCYAYRVCCENVDPCANRLYLPLMLDVPGVSVEGD